METDHGQASATDPCSAAQTQLERDFLCLHEQLMDRARPLARTEGTRRELLEGALMYLLYLCTDGRKNKEEAQARAKKYLKSPDRITIWGDAMHYLKKLKPARRGLDKVVETLVTGLPDEDGIVAEAYLKLLHHLWNHGWLASSRRLLGYVLTTINNIRTDRARRKRLPEVPLHDGPDGSRSHGEPHRPVPAVVFGTPSLGQGLLQTLETRVRSEGNRVHAFIIGTCVCHFACGSGVEPNDVLAISPVRAGPGDVYTRISAALGELGVREPPNADAVRYIWRQTRGTLKKQLEGGDSSLGYDPRPGGD